MARYYKYQPNQKNNGGRKKDIDSDTFFCEFILWNSNDPTKIKHQFSGNGNKEGLINLFKHYFTFINANHHKPITLNKKLPYLDRVSPKHFDIQSKSTFVNPKENLKSDLIDRRVLSTPKPLTKELSSKLTSTTIEKIKQSELLQKLSTLTPNQLDKLIKLIE